MTRVLIAADEPLIALDWQEELTAAGYEVVGPFLWGAEVMKSLKAGLPDVALLDFLLADGPCNAAVDALSHRDVPAVLCSGEMSAAAPAKPGVHWIPKPAKIISLIMAIEGALADQNQLKRVLGPALAAIVLVGRICDACV